MSFYEKVYRATQRIPEGKVLTYKDIARMIRNPKASRAVGSALKKNYAKGIPCHRVVRSDGELGGYNKGSEKKKELLNKEGIEVTDNKIDLKRFLWIKKRS